jgi:hypothetical protein
MAKVRELADGRGLVKISPVTRAVIDGTEDLSTWSDEELERGIRRGRDGKFRKPPRLVAKAVHDELVRRKMTKAYSLLRESTHKAVEVLIEVATDRKADPAVRVKAAEAILDRSLGKPTESMRLSIDGSEPWQRLIANAIVPNLEDARALMDANTVEGEVVEESG